MEFKEWLTGYRNRKSRAKAQRRRERQAHTESAQCRGQNCLTTLHRNGRVQLFFAALRLCGRLLLLLSLAITASAQARRPMGPADILRVANVSDAQISPGGDWIAYTVSTVDGDATRSTIW